MLVPTTSKKHFDFISNIIKQMEYQNPSVRAGVARRFATDLAATNHLFDRAQFLRACGVED